MLAFDNAGLTVLTNFGATPVPPPPGQLVATSGPLDAHSRVPTDVTVWVRSA